MSDFVAKAKAYPLFWEGAFLFAFVLLIMSHKISIEGMISS
jgi:hypothetical protein